MEYSPLSPMERSFKQLASLLLPLARQTLCNACHMTPPKEVSCGDRRVEIFNLLAYGGDGVNDLEFVPCLLAGKSGVHQLATLKTTKLDCDSTHSTPTA